MTRLIEAYCRCLEFDLEVMSHKEMYLPLFVPAIVYCAFMLIKWAMLTCPFWIPVWIILDRVAFVVCCYSNWREKEKVQNNAECRSTGDQLV